MSRTLSEAESKKLLESHGVQFLPEELVSGPDEAAAAAQRLGFPVVAKLCGDNIAHKTERGLVRLGLNSAEAVSAATRELLDAALPGDSALGVLVAPMVDGDRELIAGANRDAQFGPTVLVGVGGVLAEAIEDVAVRLAPITPLDAREMVEQLGAQRLLGEFRGEPPVDVDVLVGILMALSAAVTEPLPDGSLIASVDLNPLIVHRGRPVPVDALVELADPGPGTAAGASGAATSGGGRR